MRTATYIGVGMAKKREWMAWAAINGKGKIVGSVQSYKKWLAWANDSGYRIIRVRIVEDGPNG